MASSGDLERVYVAEFAQMVRVAGAICDDREAGRDVVQDAFVQALRSLSSFRGEGSLEAWAWAIVVNTARSGRRRRIARPVADLLTSGVVMGGADGSVVREKLRRLPERQRHAVFLRYFADMDYRTIAQVLGVEVGTVSAALSAAHSSLRTLLEGVHQP